MSRELNIGFIGTSFIAQVAHLVHYSNFENVKIASVAELRPNLGKAVCKKFNISHYTNNYHELLDRDDLDAIITIVQRSHTGPIALDVLEAKKNLFTEKPMAQTLEKAKLLSDTAKKII